MLAQLIPVSGGFAPSQSRAPRRSERGNSIAGQPERAAERQPVLMAIQLPDHFVIAAGRIEIGHTRPRTLWRGAAVDRIVIPVWKRGRCTGIGGLALPERGTEPQTAVAEEIVFPRKDAISAFGGVTGRVGNSPVIRAATAAFDDGATANRCEAAAK